MVIITVQSSKPYDINFPIFFHSNTNPRLDFLMRRMNYFSIKKYSKTDTFMIV